MPEERLDFELGMVVELRGEWYTIFHIKYEDYEKDKNRVSGLIIDDEPDWYTHSSFIGEMEIVDPSDFLDDEGNWIDQEETVEG